MLVPCDSLREYFFGLRSGASTIATLYEALQIDARASSAEIRVAFNLRDLELQTRAESRADRIKLERAFNILGYPELRAHYDSLLIDPDIPAMFPYGGFGTLLTIGERSRDGQTFFARRILSFLPELRYRHFHLPLHYCDFYSDKMFCRDSRRRLEFWLDTAQLYFSWDSDWNRWKHLLSAKLEVEGAFVRIGKQKRNGNAECLDWETALPSRLQVRSHSDLRKDAEKARTIYCRLGQHSRALDQVRLCLQYKAIERKELERICSELGLPADFEVTQISWRPDYDFFFYRALSQRARKLYLFRDQYIFELERAVVVETRSWAMPPIFFPSRETWKTFSPSTPKPAKTISGTIATTLPSD